MDVALVGTVVIHRDLDVLAVALGMTDGHGGVTLAVAVARLILGLVALVVVTVVVAVAGLILGLVALVVAVGVVVGLVVAGLDHVAVTVVVAIRLIAGLVVALVTTIVVAAIHGQADRNRIDRLLTVLVVEIHVQLVRDTILVEVGELDRPVAVVGVSHDRIEATFADRFGRLDVIEAVVADAEVAAQADAVTAVATAVGDGEAVGALVVVAVVGTGRRRRHDGDPGNQRQDTSDLQYLSANRRLTGLSNTSRRDRTIISRCSYDIVAQNKLI